MDQSHRAPAAQPTPCHRFVVDGGDLRREMNPAEREAADATKAPPAPASESAEQPRPAPRRSPAA